MKPLELEEKIEIKLRYATALHKAFKASGLKSFRKIASLAGMEPSHIQRIASGKNDVTLTTNVAISKALGITYGEFARYFDEVTSSDIQEFVKYLDAQKKSASKSKKA
ncbi:helix-turn-helix domain-containing protein [Chitinophaga rhizosphaerae]|uniref:helix-turn-helix domain-containing protein n=1 Tax=Chitinophaga rhizosphaerae TaxID=1864947 RepID=UPI000F8145CB|nr:helix-turn-helix transcriptional regulator [Chitinophaga rhizosphaerae]